MTHFAGMSIPLRIGSEALFESSASSGTKLATQAPMTGKVYIGTSGWAYKYWAQTFYPAGLGAKRQLAHYMTRFPTVELNATFYRLPSEQGLDGWRAQAPHGFVYAVKGSRTVTHYFKLRPGAKSFDLLLSRIERLGPHLGPVLWQLPASFPKDLPRLDAFLGRLPRRYRHAIELRDISWLDAEVFACLRRHGVAHVSLSAAWFPMDLTLTADFTYVRFHGLAGGAAHHYTEEELDPWARHLRRCARRGIDAYAYFNNDADTRAPHNALTLMRMVAPYAVRPASRPRAQAAAPALHPRAP
jgi:uncharacterized protein YecE (DUF72 family)